MEKNASCLLQNSNGVSPWIISKRGGCNSITRYLCVYQHWDILRLLWLSYFNQTQQENNLLSILPKDIINLLQEIIIDMYIAEYFKPLNRVQLCHSGKIP